MTSVTLFAVALAMLRLIGHSPSQWNGLQAIIASGCVGAGIDLLITRRARPATPK